jgi:predicted ATPase
LTDASPSQFKGIKRNPIGSRFDADSQSWELRAATSLSRLWDDRGRRKEALELLAPIYDRFTGGFEVADLRAANALIGEIRARRRVAQTPLRRR